MSGTGAMIDCGNGVRLERGRRMATRDGVTLVSDHYLPAGAGPHPVLLMRQPYGRDIASTVVYAHPVWFARHGYHVVIQDVRGRGDSEGDFYPFRHEGPDGFDTVQWAAQLPESNGRVAMYGFSYQAMTQFLAAAEQPPALKAIAPGMAATDLYHGWFYQGGMFKLAGGIGWGTQMLREDALRRGLTQESRALERAWSGLGAYYNQAPYGDLPHLTARGLPTYYSDWVRNDRPGAYWEELDVSSRLERITVPALHVAGWYDMFCHGSLDGFTSLAQKAGTDAARRNQYLIAGPWQHIPWSNLVGELDFGPEARLDTDRLLLAWFDHWLKEDGSFAQEPKARIFTMGANRWHGLETWPPQENCETMSYFLHSAGKANSSKGDGTLTTSAPGKEEERDVVVVDPEVPVGAPGGPLAAPGPFRQDKLAAGNNVLVYTSEPLAQPVHVCGQPRVRLEVGSSSALCDLVVKLVRVDARGQAWNVCLGAARAERLFPAERLEADTVRAWDFALEGTSCVFAAGECIRLEVAGTAFPLLDRASNLSHVPARAAGPGRWRRVTHQLLHTAEKPSSLELPLLTLTA
jgi:putative CocE/NonD family hydrolase